MDDLTASLAAFEKMRPARRSHAVALGVAVMVTALAWWLGGPAWLRWGVLPTVAVLVAVFVLAHRWLEGRMRAGLCRLERQVKEFETCLREGRAAAPL